MGIGAHLVVLLSFLVGILTAAGFTPIYNIADFKAVGDGKTDDTQAFLKAWEGTCADSRSPTFLVPSGKTFLLSQITFEGHCKSKIHVQISGNLVAPNKLWTTQMGNWITFIHIDGLTIDGNGRIDGRGPIWWACKAKNRCNVIPNGIGILDSHNLQLRGLNIINSPGKHLTLDGCIGVNIEKLTITAPGDSPNTDGILLNRCQHVVIHGITIGTGDDCIAILSGTSDVNISHVTCGPGHGISIGSLGGFNSRSAVEQIHVSYCNIFQALTGIRIKTWQGGSGYARGLFFDHINFNYVQTPIVIDQYYCGGGNNCPNKTSAVQVSDVRYFDVHGSASGDVGIRLACSKTVGCKGILVSNVSINSVDPTKKATSYCLNAHGDSIGRVLPNLPCLA